MNSLISATLNSRTEAFFFFFKWTHRFPDYITCNKATNVCSAVTLTPGCLWHCRKERFYVYSWNRRHTDCHLHRTSRQPVPGVCYHLRGHCSSDRRCSCVAHYPLCCWSQLAAGKWTGFLHCLCAGCLFKTLKVKWVSEPSRPSERIHVFNLFFKSMYTYIFF